MPPSVATALASCAAWIGVMSARPRRNSNRARISSSGRSGLELSPICGFEAAPVTPTVTVVLSTVVLAAKSSSGSRDPENPMAPREKSNRCDRMLSRPRRMANRPSATGLDTGPFRVSDPPSSASMPRPRIKIRFAARMARSSCISGPPDWDLAFCFGAIALF